MTAIVECSGLTKRYGRVIALDGLDLSVEAGQVFGFLGPNGAGKTTTMRILLGLIRPSAGRAWLNGQEVPDPAGLVRVGSMIEEPAFYPWLTGRRNLEVLSLAGPPLLSPDAVVAALDRAGLTGVAHRKVKGFSQGMRQRLGLAAALLRRPALLMLDEPTNGMDPAGIREFRSLLRSLADDGTTVFLSSHLLAEVEQVCDQVAVLDCGRLIRQGSVAELTATWARLRVVVDQAQEPAALALLSRWRVESDGSGSLLIETQDGRAVNAALGSGGVWARQIGVEQSGLEDVFIRLTGDGPTTPADVPDAASSR